MCRVLKVVIVAPPDEQLELRRSLSSISYEIVAALAPGDPLDVTADVVVMLHPTAEEVRRLHDEGHKVVAIGGDASDADLALDPEDVKSFRERVWELFRP